MIPPEMRLYRNSVSVAKLNTSEILSSHFEVSGRSPRVGVQALPFDAHGLVTRNVTPHVTDELASLQVSPGVWPSQSD